MPDRFSRRRDTAAIVERMGRVRLFAVFMRPTAVYDVESPRGRDLMLDHLDWLLDLEDEGRLFAGGPLRAGGPVGAPPRESGVDPTGFFVIGAASLEEAQELVAGEPFACAGWRTCVVHTWLLNEGVTISVGRRVEEIFGGPKPELGTASWERTDESGKGA
ncbi:hypothetical protein OEIGOIKO_00553 [Streptomyces chrestomyceticus JCM 4735]|uniref:YCII-related domain-containing protein n=2 Tax=Streptomyces chrestomyceticus TaxID=68185 RepID=A0A7U9KP43_9ACTN|nr:hypothetical protein OEIGOIKO_00553 [Streptomyces chrestomyceticus JCM 4735]